MTHEISSPVQIGQRYRFHYPREFTTLPEYTRHAQQEVQVTRRLGPDEAQADGEPMFEIIAPDGWVGHAFESELGELSPIG